MMWAAIGFFIFAAFVYLIADAVKSWEAFEDWQDETGFGLADADDVYDHQTDAPVWDESFTAADIRWAHQGGAVL